MKRKSKPNFLENLLYKPIVIIDGNNEKLVIIYGLESNNTYNLSTKGKPSSDITDTIHFIDITSTILSGSPALESCIVYDKDKFQKNIKEFTVADHADELIFASNMLISSITETASRLQEFSKALNTIRYVSANYGPNKDKGNFIVATENGGLANIVFNTIDGDVATLESKDIERMGNIIMEVIISNVSKTFDTEESIRRLRAEIEFKLIEALPDRMKAGDISVNIDCLLKEITKLQSREEEELDQGENNE